MGLINPNPFDKERFITDEFEVGEEIVIVSMNKFAFGKVDFVNKAIVTRGMKLRGSYYGVQFIYHGYAEYKSHFDSLLGHKAKEYEDIKDAPLEFMFNRSDHRAFFDRNSTSEDITIVIIVCVFLALLAGVILHQS